MKWIDEKGRLFGKLNLFDLLILLVLVVGVVGMAFRLVIRASNKAETQTAVYTVTFSNLEECHATAFAEGDPIYEENVLLGTVTGVEVSPAKTAKLQLDGTVALEEHLLYYDVELTFTTDRLLAEGGYAIDGQEMLAGTSHIFSNGFAAATGVIREVQLS